jgi:sodium transport system ATP-binding protein
MIEVRSLCKSFGEINAVRNVTFTAENGKVTGLLGPNGAGKSTTLRILYGLLTQDSGDALIDGVEIKSDRLLAQRKIGVLPDSHGLYIRLTAREHIHYFGRLHGIDRNLLETRTNELIRLLNMESIADRRVEGFSQGERMKVCLARSLIHDPPNVLLDEPTNGLDVMTTRTVREIISELKQRDITVLFSSHLMHEVSRLCDHIIIVSEGSIVASGSTDKIRAAAQEDNLEDAFVKLVEGVTS